MNVKEFLNYLPVLFKSEVTPLIWGIHGIGKSAVPEQFAEANGHRLFNLRLGNMEVADLLGLPDFDTDENGRKTATRFISPDWLTELTSFATANPDKYAILFLDEINRVRKDMLNPVFQIALDRCLHTFKFPSNVRVIAAANPPMDNGKDVYWVNDLTESALLDRFCHLKFRPSTDEWVDYMEAHEARADVVSFIKDNPSHLHSVQTDFSVDDYSRPSNRSWASAERLLKNGAGKELIYGCIGVVTGASYYKWVEENGAKIITFDDILGMETKGYLKDKKLQKRVKELVKSGKISELANLVNDIEKVCKERSVDGQTEFSLEVGTNLVAFIDELPLDLAYRTLNELCLMNAICHQICEIDEDDKREGLELQKKLYNKMETALKSGKIDRAALDETKKSA